VSATWCLSFGRAWTSSTTHDEQREFMRLLRKFVHLNDQQNKPEERQAKG
jgi:hypothetical protein